MLAGIPLWVCHLCGYLGRVLVCSKTHHWFCCFWVHLSGAQIQVYVRHCVYLTLSCSSGVTMLFTVCGCICAGCVWEGSICVQGSAFPSLELGTEL